MFCVPNFPLTQGHKLSFLCIYTTSEHELHATADCLNAPLQNAWHGCAGIWVPVYSQSHVQVLDADTGICHISEGWCVLRGNFMEFVVFNTVVLKFVISFLICFFNLWSYQCFDGHLPNMFCQRQHGRACTVVKLLIFVRIKLANAAVK